MKRKTKTIYSNSLLIIFFKIIKNSTPQKRKKTIFRKIRFISKKIILIIKKIEKIRKTNLYTYSTKSFKSLRLFFTGSESAYPNGVIRTG